MVFPDSLRELISRGEGEELEFKRGIAERSAAAKTICAMLNGSRGGTIIFGVRDSGEVIGLETGHETHDRLRGEFSKIDPAIILHLETLAIDDRKNIIVIRVPGNTGLYTYDARPYTRFGATTSLMPESSYQSALLERHHATTRWENQTASSLSISDLEESDIRASIVAAVQSGRLTDPGTGDVRSLLNGLNLLDDRQLLNAAAVLFGKQHVLEQKYPQCRLRMARFKGIDKTEFADNRQLVGNLFTLFQQAQIFFATHVEVASRIVPDQLERVDTPTYPFEALREALVNALCHRDYAEAGGGVDIAIYDDRLEITSSGPLRFGLTVDDLLQEHQSKLWNPLIANVLYKRGIIESWGRGTLKILELNRLAGLRPAEFANSRLSFTVRFFAEGYTAPTRISHDLTRLHREILFALQELGPSSVSEIAERLPGTPDQRIVSRNLQALRDYGLVVLRGRRRWARWALSHR